ncbi:MAG: hypothetical protein A3F72_08090 [Bacteroidetes bacterium RIFCSPLOWO2_12_FULL_35_15]|nr:MAG: hypothetical protein A3F72_08090 [Bacteroidetes bacterium RIFCSPLOWO2_12_FULL_35_15]
MKTTLTLKSLFLGLGFFAAVTTFAQKSKLLEGKKYAVNFYDVKAAGRGKAVPSFVTIKSGKVQSDLMEEKIQLPLISYKITLDSTYTEDEMEMHLIKFEAEFTEDKNEYKWEAQVINYDIEGTVVQSKNGVEKKKYEFDGSEKPKKK